MNEKYLKIITIIVLAFNLMQIIDGILNIYRNYFYLDNPLIPKDLFKYIAFPYFFVVPLFCGIAWYSYSCLIRRKYNHKIIIALLIFTMLYLRFGLFVLLLIRKFNPYGI